MATSNFWQRIHANVPSLAWNEAGSGSSALPGSSSKKRLLDLITSFAALLVLSPVLLAVAVAVLFDTRGSVLFRSRRIGKGGRPFECLKFRTMSQEGSVTRLGALLRSYGLDELPQLINVLKGDMSVVGPRPVLAGTTDQPKIARLARFSTKPGITGLWSVQQDSYPGFGAYVSAEHQYLQNWNVWLDIKIMVRSLGAAFEARGC